MSLRILTVVLLLGLLVGTARAAADGAGVATVVALQGSAVRAPSEAELETGALALAEGSSISKGDCVRTGADSTVDLLFGACRTRMTLGPSSTLRADAYVKRIAERRVATQSLFSVLTGKLRFVTDKIFGRGNEMTFKTEAACCAVRGTAGYVQAGGAPGGASVFANVTGDGESEGTESMVVFRFGPEATWPQGPDALFRLALQRGTGLLPGFQLSAPLRGSMGGPEPQGAELIGAVLRLCGNQNDQQRLVQLSLATLARRLSAGGVDEAAARAALQGRLDEVFRAAGGVLSPGLRRDLRTTVLQQGRQLFHRLLQGAVPGLPTPVQKVRQMSPSDLRAAVEGARFSVQVERIKTISGTNPLPSALVPNPLSGGPPPETILYGLTTLFADIGPGPDYYIAGIDVDPTTRAVTLRNDGGGSALVVRCQSNVTGIPGTMEAFPEGGWLSPLVWHEDPGAPIVLPKPYFFPVTVPQAFQLRALVGGQVVILTLYVEALSAFPPITWYSSDLRLHLVSITWF